MKALKKLFSTIITFAVIGIIMASPVEVSAMTESDMDAAQEITIGEKIKGSVEDITEVWFKFTTNAKIEPWYRISCIYKDESNYGPHMYLYNEEGIELFEKGMNDGVNNFKDIKLDPTTTYYVYLTLSKNTDYTVSINEIKDDVSDQDENAVTIYSGIKVKGEFECVSDSDVYTFTAGSSKTTLSASLKYGDDRRANAKVYDEDGKKLLDEDVYNGNPETFTIETVKGLKYIVIYQSVEPSYSIVEGGGTYSLTVKSGSSDINKLTMDSIYNSETKDVYLFNGKVRLIKGTDYTISVGKISGGKATITVKGKGSYSGKLTKKCYVAG